MYYMTLDNHNRLHSIKLWRGLLLLIWLAGLFTGYVLAHNARIDLTSVMLPIATRRVSIVGFLLVLTVPLIVSAICINLSVQWLFIPIAYIKAFFFSYSSCCIILSFGTAGWLVQWLYLFSDSIAISFMLLFWFRNLEPDRGSARRDFVMLFLMIIAIGCVDYYIISAFLSTLFNH